MSLTLPHLKFNDRGEEIMDKTPISKTLRVRPQSEYQRIRALIKQELSQEARNQGFETEAEANDFAVGDDYDPTSPFEESFDPDTGHSSFDGPFIQEKPVDKSAPERGEGGDDPPVDPPSIDKND